MLPFLCFGPKRAGIFNAIVNIGSISPCPEYPLCFPIRHDFRTCFKCVGQAAFDKLLCIDNHVHGVFRRFYFLSLEYLCDRYCCQVGIRLSVIISLRGLLPPCVILKQPMLHASTNADGKRKMASPGAISAIMTTIRLRVDRVGVVMRPFCLSIRISPLFWQHGPDWFN